MNKRKIIFILLFLSLVFIGYGILLAEEWISFIQFTDANGIPRGDSITECFVKPQHSDDIIMAIESPRGIASIVASPSLSKLMLAAPAGNGAVSESGRALDSTTGGYLSNVVVDTCRSPK